MTTAATRWLGSAASRFRAAAVLLALAGPASCAGVDQAGDGDKSPSSRAAAATQTALKARPAASVNAAGSTYYIRTDGGDAQQCTGRANAAYSGNGAGQACAWGHPFHALPPAPAAARIAGGDTLLIGPGSYMIGPGAPGAGACNGSACVLSPVPSAPAASAKTRILGNPCLAMPKLWGSGGVGKVLNLEGSSNVEVGCLDISDRDDCVFNHGNPAARCAGGAWAKSGVSARASRNVWLHDLNIHGLAANGINAGGLVDWTVERSRIVANGRAGWDGNVGKTGSANAGRIILRDVEIAWNGCGERWQSGQPWACWAQKTGGYGDGLGTKATGGQWLIERARIHHNTSDGLDLRYMDGADSTSVMVRGLYAAANAGNQVKIRGNSTIENSVIVGSCAYFSGKHFMIDGDLCRAGGNAVQLVLTPGDVATVRHNTITGQGGVLIGAGEGDASARVDIQNNVLVGAMRFRKPGVPAATYYANKAPATVNWAGNLMWNVKSDACPPDSVCGQNPKLANMELAAFDAEPLPGSPVIGKAPRLEGVGKDFRGRQRPSGGKADIGAIQARAR